MVHRFSGTWNKRKNLMKAVENESGQGLVEYALILVLVAVTVILILTILGSTVVLDMPESLAA